MFDFNDFIKSVFVLVIVVFLSITALSYVYLFTIDTIEENKNKDFFEKMGRLFPEVKNLSFSECPEIKKCFVLYSSNQKNKEDQVGYAIVGKKYGYSSEIQMLVGLDNNKVIKNVQVLNHLESPGIGSKIEDESYLMRFINKEGKDVLLKKHGGVIDGISGATVSSTASSTAVYNAIERMN